MKNINIDHNYCRGYRSGYMNKITTKVLVESEHDIEKEKQTHNDNISEKDSLLKSRFEKFVCEDCGHTFKNITYFKEHRFKHLPIEEYPFQCDQCEKRYVSQRTYKEHLMRHAGIKNFVCPHCDMRKTSRSEIRAHINYHTKDKQWPCPHCPSIFNRSSNLGLHDRVVHQGIRRYSCRYCDHSFGKAETLKHHEMRHTGEKPHECTDCEKRFIQLVALKAHQKTHDKVKNGNPAGV